MGKAMNEDKIKALAAELAKDLKTPEDVHNQTEIWMLIEPI